MVRPAILLERRAAQLAAVGITVTLARVADVSRVAPFDAVMPGSPVYQDDWLPEVAALLDSLYVLANKNVWLVSGGPLVNDAETALAGGMHPERLESLITITPSAFRSLAGK